MATVNPTLAKFAVDTAEFIEKMYDKYAAEDPEFFAIYAPEIKIFTVDGLTVEFFEEGIEFYPEEK